MKEKFFEHFGVEPYNYRCNCGGYGYVFDCESQYKECPGCEKTLKEITLEVERKLENLIQSKYKYIHFGNDEDGCSCDAGVLFCNGQYEIEGIISNTRQDALLALCIQIDDEQFKKEVREIFE